MEIQAPDRRVGKKRGEGDIDGVDGIEDMFFCL